MSQFGGAWLLGETAPGTVFTPEDRSDEHRMIADTAQAFMDQEVIPRREALESNGYARAGITKMPTEATRSGWT